MKKIAILGSTGSIGTNTLNVIRHLKGEFEVLSLAAKSNIDLLEQQIIEFSPKVVAVYDKDKALELQKRCPKVKIVAGIEGLNEVASHSDVEFVVSAITGTLGLIPTITAIEAKKDIGLANKEVLVSGGAFVTGLAKKNKVKILPIDSEHNAIFQCLQKEKKTATKRIILTASGGPFRTMKYDQLANISVESALNHPTWSMGPKVTVDSSTLMNKGLEVIEAHWLFNMPIEKISVVIHPQSIIHSMVEFIDNSIIAQMGFTDMKIPIQYALTYPERLPGTFPPFDFMKHHTLQFFTPDTEKFRCLDLAFESLKAGGTLPGYMNAANEVLVNRFLNKQISWLDIPRKLEDLMSKHDTKSIESLDCILWADQLARQDASTV
jgi:1-deoxy-D-xylulose-5-phosphate reductoisomerase